MPKLLIATTVPLTLKAFLLPYSDHFRKLGWRVDCLANGAASDETCAAHFDNCFDIDWSRNPLSPANMLKCPGKLREVAERERYDIVHVHTPVAAFVTRFALMNLRKKIGTKIIYTAHGFHFHKGGGSIKNFIFKSMEQIAARWADTIIVMNEEDFAAAKKIYPSEQVTKMNGIGLDLNYYSPSNIPQEQNSATRSSLGLSPEDKLFVMVAEFNPEKYHADVLHALSLIEEKNFHVAFAGTGPLMEEIKKLSENLKISDRVHFLGFVQDIRPLIMASNATLMPSKREGLPRCVMESMALGTPVIGTDIRGTRDLLSDECGLLVPVRDPAAIARAMKMCASGSAGIEKIKFNAANKIKNYGIEKLIKEHEKIYERKFGD